MPGWKHDMIDLAAYAFGRLRARVEGLTDAEYFWEPVPGCWSVRKNADGEYRGDWDQPVWPPPVTTIAWRLVHVIDNFFDPRYATFLGQPHVAAAPPTPGTAGEAIAALDQGFPVMRSYLEATDDASLATPLGDIAGPWASDDRASFVLHMLDELIHHGAEIGVLRDLYRASQPPNPIVDALLAGDGDAVESMPERDELLARARAERADLMLQATAQGRWDAVPLLVGSGFPLAMPDGTSALHHAAAAGHLATLSYLVDAGADCAARDSLYRATPQEWAEFFGQHEAAERLRR